MVTINISVASVRVIVEMSWPYHFVNLSPEQIAERRKLLDLYGIYAWLSPITLVLLIYVARRLLARFAILLARFRSFLARLFHTPSRLSGSKPPNFFQINTRRLLWLLDTPLESDFGTVKVQLVGAVYTGWLLFLAIYKTGDDYMHFTKRLGHVAVSQLPFQYLLSIKSPLSPIQVATNLTHETLNPYHRLAGRIIHLFLLAHSLLYLNFFFWISALPRRLYDRDVRIGLVSITLLTILAITASPPIRQKAYHKNFYVPHAFLSFLLIPAIAAHVPYTRRYIIQNLMIYLFNVAIRKFNTETPFQPAIVTPVPNTDNALLHVSIPTKRIPFGSQIPTWIPGQHMYIKAGDNPKFPRSPFTILSVPPTFPNASEKEAYHGYPLPPREFLIRNLGGPTTKWLAGTNVSPKQITDPHNYYNYVERDFPFGLDPKGSAMSTTPSSGARPGNTVPVLLEGPYGSSSSYLPDLFSSLSNPSSETHHSSQDEILLVAGGVGATYILPIYVSLLTAIAIAQTLQTQNGSSILEAEKRAREMRKRIHLHWIVRTRAEAEWGIEYLRKAMKTLKDGKAVPRHQYRSEDFVSQDEQTNGTIPMGISHGEGQEGEEGKMGLNVNIHITRNDNSTDPAPLDQQSDNNNEKEACGKETKLTDILPLSPSPSPSPPLSRTHTQPQPPSEQPSKPSLQSESDLPRGTQILSRNSHPSISSLLANTSLDTSNNTPKQSWNKIYVLICAPPSLSRGLRKEVGSHVIGYGREVVWCEEGFGMGA